MDKTLQPNSRHCFVCGLANAYGLHLRFFNHSEGEVIADYTVSEQYQGYPGVVHGGIVAAMLDEAAGRCLMYSGSDPQQSTPRFMYTARLEIRYRQNVPVGQPLRIIGQASKIKARAAQAKSYIYDSTGSLLAEADVLLVDVPGAEFSGDDLDTLGWKVYPLEEAS